MFSNITSYKRDFLLQYCQLKVTPRFELPGSCFDRKTPLHYCNVRICQCLRGVGSIFSAGFHGMTLKNRTDSKPFFTQTTENEMITLRGTHILNRPVVPKKTATSSFQHGITSADAADKD